MSAAKETEINRQMADAGNAATVGIYCKRGKHETYFGTGAVISADGHIVTSTTVVPEGATEIKVYFTNHHRRAAALVEVNKELETSLLKVDATGLPCLALATTLPKVGEQAYTLGNANNMILLGEQASFSAGIVSGLYAVKSADTQSSYAGLAIETDAAINPGQDGGPLLNNAGQLAGIISLSYSKARWQGLAIPMIKVIDGLRALKEKRVSFSTKPLLTPPDEDTATGTRLARAAENRPVCRVSPDCPPVSGGRPAHNQRREAVGGGQEFRRASSGAAGEAERRIWHCRTYIYRQPPVSPAGSTGDGPADLRRRLRPDQSLQSDG